MYMHEANACSNHDLEAGILFFVSCILVDMITTSMEL